MRLSRFIALSTISAALVAASACSSSSGGSTSSATASLTAASSQITVSTPGGSTPKAPITTTAPVVTDAPSDAPASTGYFADAYEEICAMDRQTLELGVEVYLAMNGESEVAEAQLVADDVLREESEFHDIGPGNIVVATPTGPCTG